MTARSKTKIVVVDDDTGILEGFQAVLEDENYNVTTYSDGDALLNLTKDDLPDLIILDVLLSGKDGREISKILKDNPLTQKIPVIMVSAHPKVEESVKECGADDFIKPPFELDDLLEKVRKYIP